VNNKRFSIEQLAALLKRIERGIPRRYYTEASEPKQQPAEKPGILDQIIKFGQISTPLAIAAWTVWIYVNHTEEEERLKLSQLTLTNEQQAQNNAQTLALASTEKEIRKITLEQQKAALSQTEIERQQKLLSVRASELDARAKELDIRSKSEDEKIRQQSRITTEVNLSIECQPQQKNMYMVIWSLTITNTSEREVEISLAVINRYIGVLSPMDSPAARISHESPLFRGRIEHPENGSIPALPLPVPAEDHELNIYLINDVPIPILGPPATGDIVWKQFGETSAYAYATDEAFAKMSENLPGYHLHFGGGGTKLVRKGDESYHTEAFLVKSPPGNWIGVSHSISLNRAVEGDDLLHFSREGVLPPCDGSSGDREERGATPAIQASSPSPK
jgi:hypothetical protein